MQLFIAYIVFLGCLILRTSAQVVTPITAFSDYIAARGCVQTCAFFAMQYGLCSGIGFGAQCAGCPGQNSLTCLCGTIGDVSASISSVVYSCASSACNDAIEATSAANIFHEYCTAGAAAEAHITAAATPSATLGSRHSTFSMRNKAVLANCCLSDRCVYNYGHHNCHRQSFFSHCLSISPVAKSCSGIPCRYFYTLVVIFSRTSMVV